MVRIPGVCNHDPDTVVLAHINGGGMGLKRADIHASFCCSACHDVIDGRARSVYSKDALLLMHLEGMLRTQEWWIKNNLIAGN